MKQYKVNYVAYDTLSWSSYKGSKVVLASSEEVAKNIIESQSEMGGYDYCVESVVLMEE